MTLKDFISFFSFFYYFSFPFLGKEVVCILVRFQLLRLKSYKSQLGEEKVDFFLLLLHSFTEISKDRNSR